MGRQATRRAFGDGDASFQAAGGVAGIRMLVDDFFDRMSTDPRFRTIHDMHPADAEISRDKLARFLSGWLGGPRLYSEKYGSISIPRAHQHLPVHGPEKTQWLTCMAESIAMQPYSADFKEYLLGALEVPAEGVRRRREKIEQGHEVEQS